MGKINIEIPKDIKKLHQQIQALEYLIKHDTNEKDKTIHQGALEGLRAALKESTKIS